MSWKCPHGKTIYCDWTECGLCTEVEFEAKDRYYAEEQRRRLEDAVYQQQEEIKIQAATDRLQHVAELEAGGRVDAALASSEFIEPVTKKQKYNLSRIMCRLYQAKGNFLKAAEERVIACTFGEDNLTQAYLDATSILLDAPDDGVFDKTQQILDYVVKAERLSPGKAIRSIINRSKYRGLALELTAIEDEVAQQVIRDKEADRAKEDAEQIERFAKEGARKEAEEEAKRKAELHRQDQLLAAQIKRQEKLELEEQKQSEKSVQNAGCGGCSGAVVGAILALILSIWSLDSNLLVIFAIFCAFIGAAIGYNSKS